MHADVNCTLTCSAAHRGKSALTKTRREDQGEQYNACDLRGSHYQHLSARPYISSLREQHISMATCSTRSKVHTVPITRPSSC